MGMTSARFERVADKARARAWRRAIAGHRLFVQAEMLVSTLERRSIPWWAIQ